MPLANDPVAPTGTGKPRRPRPPKLPGRSTSITPTPPRVTPSITPVPKNFIGPRRSNFVPSAPISHGRVRQAPTAYGPPAPGYGIGVMGGPPVGSTNRVDAALNLINSTLQNNEPEAPNVLGQTSSYSTYAQSLGQLPTEGRDPINIDSPINPDRIPSQVLTDREIRRRMSKRGGFGLYGARSPIEGFDFDSDTNTFGPRVHPVHGGRSNHTGEDMSVAMGTPITAPVGGIVKSVNPNAGAYGMQVIVDHGNGEETMYGHMSGFNVKPGQRIKKGEVLGSVGSTGLSTGPHLHWETWKDGNPLDPNTLFDNGKRAVPEQVLEAARKKFDKQAISQPAPQQVQQPQQPNELAPNNGLNALMQAIREQESGGDYAVQNGIGAMGAYQIMPSNIEGPAGWDMEVLGRNITGQEFLNNPVLQNNIARFKLRDYFKKYGAGGAAKAWYAGPGNADLDSNAPQYGGPSVNGYAESVLELNEEVYVMEILDQLNVKNIPDLILTILLLGGLFKVGDIALKKIVSNREKVDTDAVAVTTLEKVLTTVVNEGGRKSAQLELLEARVGKLEERERHMLTRAAVHEAWDQMAFQFIVQHNPDHSPPPPLYDRELWSRHDNAPVRKSDNGPLEGSERD